MKCGVMCYKEHVRCGMGQFSRVPGVQKERQRERVSGDRELS